jgi:hypothetical protein
VVVPEVDRAAYRKFRSRVARGVNVYVLASFVSVTLATTGLLFFADRVALAMALGIAAAIVWSIVGWGDLMEGRRRGVWVECARWLAIACAVTWLAWNRPHATWIVATAIVLAASMGAWVATFRSKLSAGASADVPTKLAAVALRSTP